jgi:hypothetical protein
LFAVLDGAWSLERSSDALSTVAIAVSFSAKRERRRIGRDPAPSEREERFAEC